LSRLVIDSSVALAWLFEDEADEAALAARAIVARDGAVVPGHWRLEVAHGLMAERRGRITAAYRSDSLRDLAILPIDTDEETVSRAWEGTTALAARHRLTSYDAAYLELASRLGHPLATHGRELRAAALRDGLPVLD
jgi:predicted nucleic acid-binding protein